MASKKELITGFYNELKPIFDKSAQGMYVYIDDDNKSCNKKFSDMLGYKSPKEWSDVDYSFMGAFVAQEDQHRILKIYEDAMKKKMSVTMSVTWLTKNNKKVKTKTIMVPVSYKGQVMALQFVSK